MIRHRHALALASLLLVACDPGAELGPPAALTPGSLPASATVATTLDGVSVTVKDAEGRPLKGERVTWAADGGGSASPAESVTDAAGVATTAWTLGTTAGTQTLSASADGLEAAFGVTAVPGPLSLLEIAHAGRVLHALGDTLLLQAAAEDAYGNAVGSAVLWASLDPAVATSEGGIITAAGEGTARIVATAGALADTARVEVDQVVASLTLTPLSPRVLVKAETVQLAAVPVDSNGAAVDSAVTVSWSTSAAAVATVSGTGLVEAVGLGDAVIRATADALTGEAPISVKAGPRPSIASISPAVVTPGDTLVITGTGFSETASLNTVTVSGVPASVLAASATELTAVLSESALPCAPTTDVPVVVTVDELEGVAEHPLAAATRHALTVGESVVLTAGAVACNELADPGAYVLSVFSTGSGSGTSAFRLRGTGSATAAAAPAGSSLAAIQRRRISVRSRAPALRPDADEVGHARMLERNLALLNRLGSPLRSRTGATLRATSGTAAAVPTVGDVLPLRIPDLDGTDPCDDFIGVNARVAYVGEYGVILEDTLAPLAGDIDALWQSVGAEYDSVMHPIMLRYFGDPLVLDGSLDANGRLFMLFSNRINEMEAGLAGFVFSGDFYDRARCASSDTREIFYGRMPTSTEGGFQSGDGVFSTDEWKRSMRSTVIHEVKHIRSFASRIVGAGSGWPSWEQSWLEESTARLSEEFYARANYGYAQNENTQYEASVYCEVRPDGTRWPECGHGSPYIMAKHYFATLEYFNAMEQLTPLGRSASGDYTFYGSGWLLVRWALDQSGQDEAAFVQALVGEATLTGTDNLSARTGRPWPEMLADFSLALALDDRDGVTPARPALTLPSWDLRDIFLGFYDDFRTQLPELLASPYPLATRALGFGDFEVDVPALRGGSASLFQLEGTLSGTQLLELLSATGSVAPAHLGLAIVRVQ